MNSYEVLGVRHDATHDEIKKAYRALARRTHPDVGGDAMKPLFLSVTSAWETLSDPEKRAAYDRAHGLGTPAPSGPSSGAAHGPAPQPEDRREQPSAPSPPRADPGPDFEDFWSAAAPAPEGTVPAAADETPVPDASWREVFDAVKERPRADPLPAAAAALLLAWASLVVFLGLKELILSGPEGVLPRGSGAITYAACWAAGAWHSCYQVRRGGSIATGPLLAAGYGALTFWVMNRGHLPAAASAVAAGVLLSIAAASWLRRRENLKETGQVPSAGRYSAFAHPGEDEDAAAARAMTRRALGEILAAPGTRLLENAPVRGSAVPQIIINGDRAAVIDSRLLPGWIHEDLTGDLGVDGEKVIPNLETSIAGAVADVRSHARRVRGWLVVHPFDQGSVELKPVRGVPVRAASPSAALEEIGEWLARGPHAGRVDPELSYRVIRGSSPLVRWKG